MYRENHSNLEYNFSDFIKRNERLINFFNKKNLVKKNIFFKKTGFLSLKINFLKIGKDLFCKFVEKTFKKV